MKGQQQQKQQLQQQRHTAAAAAAADDDNGNWPGGRKDPAEEHIKRDNGAKRM